MVFIQTAGGFLLNQGILESGWGLHRNLPYVIAVLVIIHLYLNWPWVKMNYFRKK